MATATAFYDVSSALTTNIGTNRFLESAGVDVPLGYDLCIVLSQSVAGSRAISIPYAYADGNHGGETYNTWSVTYQWRNVGGVNQYDTGNPETWTGTVTGVYLPAYDVTYWQFGASFSAFSLPNGSISTAACSPYNGMGTTMNTDMASFARDYFDTPTAPYMDIDVFTTGSDENKIVTFNWKNLSNIPADMYPASYMVRVGVNYTAAPDAAIRPTVLSILPYSTSYVIPGTRDTSYQVGYLDALQSMPSAAQGYAISQDWLAFFIQLGHTEGDTTVVDAEYLFKVEKDGEITDSTDPGTGGTIGTHDNTSPRYNDDYSGDSGSIDASGTGQSLSLDNVLTTSYALTKTQLTDFGRWLWTNDLSTTVYGNEVSPIENILSCKLIPFNVASATNANIWVGNINSGVACVIASTNHEFNVGSITIDAPCGGTFLDEQNKISIYLPYCGIQSIPTGICYSKTLETVTLPNGFTKQIPKLTGRTLTVKYVFDMIYGTCAALLYMDSALFGVYNGSCGIDIPLTQSNRASNQLALNKDGGNMIAGTVTSGVSGAIGGGMSDGLPGAIIGGVISAAQSALSSLLHNKNNAANQETHFTTSGGFSSQIASFMSPNVTVFIEYTDMDSIPQGYGHENGYPCNLNLNMSDIVGYTELDGSIEISDIPCLEEERVLLKQALQEGFYL